MVRALSRRNHARVLWVLISRRKFLKSDKTEMANIAQEFQRIALANPSVAFSLTQDGKCVVSLPESGLLQRIVNLFGRKFKEQLLEIDVETTLIRIHGFVGKPDSACRKKADQYLFVNGRYMKSPYFHKAIMEAFAHLIPDDAQIPYFIYFDIDPANIDVNISPTKTEIKFENESTIWPIIVAAVRDTLGRFNAIPTLDFDVEGKPDIPAFSQADLLAAHRRHAGATSANGSRCIRAWIPAMVRTCQTATLRPKAGMTPCSMRLPMIWKGVPSTSSSVGNTY